MRDAGHRTPDAGHRTSDIGQQTSDIGHRTAKKAKIIYPQGGGHKNTVNATVFKLQLIYSTVRT